MPIPTLRFNTGSYARLLAAALALVVLAACGGSDDNTGESDAEEASTPSEPTAKVAQEPTKPPAQAEPPGPQYREIPQGAALYEAIEITEFTLADAKSLTDAEEALAALRRDLAAANPATAAAVIEAYLATGRDVSTPFPFRPSRQGGLLSAPSLRTFLLDLLGFLDPQAGAKLLDQPFSADYPPGEWALALRNKVWADYTEAPFQTRDRVAATAIDLLKHKPWVDLPDEAVLETFDFLVFAPSTRGTRLLVKHLGRADAPAINRASYLALDRLARSRPVSTAELLLDDPATVGEQTSARASIIARLDPREDSQASLYAGYLKNPAISRDERAQSLQHYPNVSVTLVPGLVTKPRDIDPVDARGRVEAALQRLATWQNDPALAELSDELAAAEQRLREVIEPHSD